MKKYISIILIFSFILTSLTGCVPERNIKYSNSPYLSEIEYLKILNAEYKTSLNMKREVKPNIIELYDVENSAKSILSQRVDEEFNNLFLKIGYNGLDSEHNYFNYLFDPWIIDRTTIKKSFYKNRSNYYVQIEANLLPNTQEVSEFKKPANYVGIYGAINWNENGELVVDDIYLKTLIQTQNTYRRSIGLDDLDEEIENIDYRVELDEDYLFSDIYTKEVGEASSSEVKEDLSEQYELDQQNENIIKEIQDDEKIEEQSKDAYNRKVRKLIYNAEDLNDVVGISRDYFSIIPNPTALFKIKDDGQYKGYHIYDWGSTIKETKTAKPKIKLMFIFQRNEYGDNFNFLTAFPMEYTTLNISQESSLKNYLNKFTEIEIEKTIEDFYRAYSNRDISRLTSGNLISPQDLGIYLLLLRDSLDISINDMWVEEILKREGSTYLLRMGQITCEIPKGIWGTPGKYYKKWLVRISVEEGSFKIIDMYPQELYCLRIPEINTIDGATEKILSIERQDMVENISDTVKNDISSELNKLCKALNYKFLNDDLNDNGTIKSKDGKEHYGIKSRFSQDTTILSESDYNDAITLLSNQLIKYGPKINCVVYSSPVQFISGNTEQVELVSKLLFVFDGKYADQWNVYMVYDKFDNKWLIDEFKVIDEVSLDKKEDIEQLIQQGYTKSNKGGTK